jgi:hypothetical protein
MQLIIYNLTTLNSPIHSIPLYTLFPYTLYFPIPLTPLFPLHPIPKHNH